MKDPVAFNPLKYVFLFHGLLSMKHSLSKQYWDYSEVAGKVFPNVIKGKKKGGKLEVLKEEMRTEGEVMKVSFTRMIFIFNLVFSYSVF